MNSYIRANQQLNRFLHAALPAFTNIYIILDRTLELGFPAIVTPSTNDVRMVIVIINDCGVIFLFSSGISSDKVKSPSLIYLTHVSYQKFNGAGRWFAIKREFSGAVTYETSFNPTAAPRTMAIKTTLLQSLDSPYKSIPIIAPPDAPIPVQIA